MANNTIQIVIKADGSGAVATIGDVTNKLGGIGQAAGTAVVAGIGAATVAIAGLGVAGLKAFGDFEQGMNEVFTLLPNISQSAMDDMTGQVKDFSKEFGTLPEEVIPALYQSLSAGIPPDNVFEFMEVAQKAAIGGVTELETAVKGISSVVNAYGSENISAAEASDIMTRSVALGATTFDELSKSLFNVNPVAAAAGVGFDEVSAALTAITVQGTPTSVATTQLRQLFVELTKAGGGTADTFKKISGKSFKDFVSSGGNVQDALILMENYAKETGVGINDLFGSVEAGSAALMLTGKGAETFAGNLEELANAGGATQGAFDKMENGIGRTFEKIKAAGSVFLIDIGERLAPTFARFAKMAIFYLAPLSDFIIGIFDKITPILDNFASFVGGLFDAFQSGGVSGLMDALGLGPAATELIGKITGDLQWLATTIQAQVGPVMELMSANVMPALSIAIAFVNEHWEAFRNALIAIIAVIAAATVFTTIAAIIAMIANPVTLVIAAVGLLAAAWTENWGGIRDIITNFWETTGKPMLTDLWNWLQVNIPIALQTLSAFWTGTLLPAIQTVWNFISTVVLPMSKMLWDWLAANLPQALQKLADFWTGTLQPAINKVWAFIQNSVIPTISTLWTWLQTNVPAAIQTLTNFWTNTLLPAINEVWAFIQDYLIPLFNAVSDLITAVLNVAIENMAALWTNNVMPAISTVWDFIDKNLVPIFNDVKDAIGDVADKINTVLQPAFNTLGNFFSTVFQSKINAIKGAFDGIKTIINDIITFIGNLTDAINNIPTFDKDYVDRSSVNRVGTSGYGGSGSTTSSVYNFNQTVNTRADSSTVIQDFQTMRALIA